MRDFVFDFDQKTMVELGLSVEEGLLLDYLVKFFDSGNAITMYVKGRKYCWITYKKMLADLPVLKKRERQTRRILTGLEQKGLIKRHLENYNKLFIYINQEVLFYGPDGHNGLSHEDFMDLNGLPVGQDVPPIVKYYKNKIKIISRNARVKDLDGNMFHLRLIQTIKPQISTYAFDKHFKQSQVDSVSDRLILLSVASANEMEAHIKKAFEEAACKVLKEMLDNLLALA